MPVSATKVKKCSSGLLSALFVVLTVVANVVVSELPVRLPENVPVKVVPLNVKFALSCNAPPAPT